ncbi:hypothetical protein A6U86_05540 [Rhizobium sp. AC27/96]|uniref:hypothetical protein n=1 Tax=Rhizobium sp. AC27/96 TaxID=1841653 RepID=UPI00082902C9|nr:hypothetical protein [Rhizobium sp. AC27/96]OCJ12485.1 hypothetical protein A6U86_05540 [Rhizobium sp. AC27/96]
MTRDQIEELFIQAAETDHRLPDTARPARLKAQAIQYYHSQADVNGWGAERFAEERADFLSHKTTRLRTSDVTKWELANALIVLVSKSRDRHCLWHWAIAKAGGKSFSKWCREGFRDVSGNHIRFSRNYALERKNRAILEITLALDCKPLQHNENGRSASLQHMGEMSDKDVILADDVPTYWRAPDARPMACDFDRGLQNFEWADLQNERRRQRDAERRKRQVAA